MNRILVTGATGTIGRHLVQRLRALQANFKTMSSQAGADVQADWADPASLRRAFDGIDTLFLLLPLVPHKLELARNAIAAARAAGVTHIVRSSGAGADPASPNALAALQGQIDALVASSGLTHTFLRPMGFMQNWASFAAAQVKSGAFYAPQGQGAQSLVDARDIADVAAAVLVNPVPHAAWAYTLTGAEALNNEQQLALISQATGQAVRYVDVPEATAEAAMQDMGMPPVMVAWFMGLHLAVKSGWAGAITNDVETLTGHTPRRFADFVLENRDAWR
jgi:NAD(P)H dehydrogenase (quinone)